MHLSIQGSTFYPIVAVISAVESYGSQCRTGTRYTTRSIFGTMPVCLICFFMSPDLDGHRAPKMTLQRPTTNRSRNPKHIQPITNHDKLVFLKMKAEINFAFIEPKLTQKITFRIPAEISIQISMLRLLAVAAALLPLALSVPVSLSHVKTASTGPPPPPTPALGFDYLHLVQVMQPQTWCCNSLQQRQRKDTRLPPCAQYVDACFAAPCRSLQQPRIIACACYGSSRSQFHKIVGRRQKSEAGLRPRVKSSLSSRQRQPSSFLAA